MNSRGWLIAAALLVLTACGSDDKQGEGDLGSGPPDSADIAVGADLEVTAPVDASKDTGGKVEVVSDTVSADITDTAAPLDLPGDAPDLVEISPEVQLDLEPEQVDVVEDVPLTIGQICFPNVYQPGEPGPFYDPFEPVIGSHCYGTNHQNIFAVEEVVFLGDSVTVGTPNLAHLLSFDNEHFYRNKMATWLAGHFDLDTGGFLDWGIWKTYDYLSGKGGNKHTGDFRHCGYWGARTDDIIEGGGQIYECLPSGGSEDRTLFLMTLGGNDIAKITQVGAEASPEEVAAGYPEAWALAESTVQHLENGVAHIKDPEFFPNGSWLVYGNGFEFTDGTGQTSSCTPQMKFDIPGVGEIDMAELGIPVALLAGYGEWEKPEVQAEIVIWMLDQYMRIAVDYQVDMIWTVESFCGHGYMAAGANADPENMCYIGPDAELYFDESCIHPSPAGHNALFEMFKAVVLE